MKNCIACGLPLDDGFRTCTVTFDYLPGAIRNEAAFRLHARCLRVTPTEPSGRPPAPPLRRPVSV